MKYFTLIALLLLSMPSGAKNSKEYTFDSAKKALFKIHKGNLDSVYCNCKYDGKKYDLKSCGYVHQGDKKRAERLEWEHIVPAEAFGRSFTEWSHGSKLCVGYKGRKCAKKNKAFAKIEADMHNLWPSIGELNGLRSNKTMAALSGPSEVDFGGCKSKIQGSKFEPQNDKGIVARAYLYMEKQYPGRGIVSSKNVKLFEAWSKMYPPMAWECERSKKIDKLQGTTNTVLNAACGM